MYSLVDVARLVERKLTKRSMSVSAYANNFHAPIMFPKKFVYYGCAFPKGGEDDLCKVSLEGAEENTCLHNPLGNSCVGAFYRFLVLLVDESLTESAFVQAKIWEAAEAFLQIPPTELQNMDPTGQYEFVHAAFSRNPFCMLKLKVLKGVVTIEDLSLEYIHLRLTPRVSPSRLGHTYRTVPSMIPNRKRGGDDRPLARSNSMCYQWTRRQRLTHSSPSTLNPLPPNAELPNVAITDHQVACIGFATDPNEYNILLYLFQDEYNSLFPDSGSFGDPNTKTLKWCNLLNSRENNKIC